MMMSMMVVKRVQQDFAPDEQASVLEYLSLYGSQDREKQVERVRLAVLSLARGNRDRVVELIGQAKRDRNAVLHLAGV